MITVKFTKAGLVNDLIYHYRELVWDEDREEDVRLISRIKYKNIQTDQAIPKDIFKTGTYLDIKPGGTISGQGKYKHYRIINNI